MSGELKKTWFQATHKSGDVVNLEAPTRVDALDTALGRIAQDLRDAPETRDAGLSLRRHGGNGVAVSSGGTRAEFPAPSRDHESGCAQAFIDAVGYLREVLQTSEQRDVLEDSLISRLPEHKGDQALALAQA